MDDGRQLRIGEISKRSGLSPERLRAWERRYGLLRPARSAGGTRLYSEEDLRRVELMQAHLAQGFAAAEAAAMVDGPASAAASSAPAFAVATVVAELTAALDAFDEPAAQDVLDRALAVATLESVIGEVILPYLSEIGARWRRGEASIAQEHFASSILRGRLLGLARGWGLGIGPVALLACVPGERHDLGLIAFGLALRDRGWRITYLGPDTPVGTVSEAARTLRPALVVLHAMTTRRVRAVDGEIEALAREQRLAISGPGAAPGELDAIGVLALTGHPLAEADRVSRLAAPAG